LYEVGAIVVMLKNPNSHDYPLGEPFIITVKEEGNGGHGSHGYIARKNEQGNNLPGFIKGDEGRLATPEEIRYYYQKLNSHNQKDIVQYLRKYIPYEE